MEEIKYRVTDLKHLRLRGKERKRRKNPPNNNNEKKPSTNYITVVVIDSNGGRKRSFSSISQPFEIQNEEKKIQLSSLFHCKQYRRRQKKNETINQLKTIHLIPLSLRLVLLSQKPTVRLSSFTFSFTFEFHSSCVCA